MKKLFFAFAVVAFCMTAEAQSIKETFDSNSLNWTECTIQNKQDIKSIIDKGVLTVSSEEHGGIDHFSQSMCYAPLDIMKPFRIKTKVSYNDEDYPFGIMFNMKDDGTFYAFSFLEVAKKIYFERYVDRKMVGGLSQGFHFPKLKKGEFYEIVITCSGQQIQFEVNGDTLFNVRYMPLDYAGFGFYTLGNQDLVIDEVEFIQL